MQGQPTPDLDDEDVARGGVIVLVIGSLLLAAAIAIGRFI